MIAEAYLYLLHFDRPYWTSSHPCRHYLGYTTKTVPERMEKHRAGNGSKLVAYALRGGCDFTVVMTQAFTSKTAARQEEKRLKRNGHHDRNCPLCRRASTQLRKGGKS